MRKYNVRFLSVSSLDIIFIRIYSEFHVQKETYDTKILSVPKKLFVFLLQYKYTHK